MANADHRLRCLGVTRPHPDHQRFLVNHVGAPLRGVTYWSGDKDHRPRILAGLSDGRLIALDAKTGRLMLAKRVAGQNS